MIKAAAEAESLIIRRLKVALLCVEFRLSSFLSCFTAATHTNTHTQLHQHVPTHTNTER